MVVKLLDSTNRTLIYKFHNYINFHKFISHFKLPFITQQNPSNLTYLDFFLLRTAYFGYATLSTSILLFASLFAMLHFVV